MTTPPGSSDVRLLTRPEGRLAYTDRGSGPLVVAVPGMGDLRSTWDDVAPRLVAAGYRVVVMDLRGHGGSDTTFRTHGDEATASDYVALVEHLEAGPAVLLGSSMAASAAVVAAADRPDLVRGLVLVDGFLRTGSAGAQRAVRALARVVLVRPWGPALWAAFYGTLAKGRRPARLAAHRAAIRASLRDPARLRSFRDLVLQLDHAVVAPRLAQVRAPALAVFGALDPDYSDPAAEAAYAEEAIGATTLVLPEVGHYPQLQAPDELVAATLDHLTSLPAHDPADPAAPRPATGTGTGGDRA
jgi:pimeloyl-ACP methyl ester carboxylesterase